MIHNWKEVEELSLQWPENGLDQSWQTRCSWRSLVQSALCFLSETNLKPFLTSIVDKKDYLII